MSLEDQDAGTTQSVDAIPTTNSVGGASKVMRGSSSGSSSGGPLFGADNAGFVVHINAPPINGTGGVYGLLSAHGQGAQVYFNTIVTLDNTGMIASVIAASLLLIVAVIVARLVRCKNASSASAISGGVGADGSSAVSSSKLGSLSVKGRNNPAGRRDNNNSTAGRSMGRFGRLAVAESLVEYVGGGDGKSVVGKKSRPSRQGRALVGFS